MSKPPLVTLPDLSGRVALITGANAGIGRITAQSLAGAGARVFLAGRSEARTMPVVEAIREAHGADRAEFLPLDLADLASVRRCADAFAATGEPLHLLINNAGLAGLRGQTAQGFEMAFGVNHLGHFLLTRLLEDRLVASAPARVVVVASKAHTDVKALDLEDVQRATRTVAGYKEYGVSKLANVLFAAELGRRLKGTGVTTYALHPGVVASEIWRKVPWPIRPLMKRFMLTEEEGAQTTLHCAAAPEVADHTGRYYDACEEVTPTELARDAALARELWDRSEAWVTA